MSFKIKLSVYNYLVKLNFTIKEDFLFSTFAIRGQVHTYPPTRVRSGKKRGRLTVHGNELNFSNRCILRLPQYLIPRTVHICLHDAILPGRHVHNIALLAINLL